jgi:hypothetical protein
MPVFVVETFVPEGDKTRFVADVSRIQAAAGKERPGPQPGAGPRHLRSYLVPGDAMGFHVIEAEASEDVARITALAGVEVERIVPTFSVGPDVSEPMAGLPSVEQ